MIIRCSMTSVGMDKILHYDVIKYDLTTKGLK